MASYINVGKRTRKEYVDEPVKWPSDVFSLLVFDSNNIEKSRKSVYIINCGIRSGLGRIKINKANLYKCMAAFTARKCGLLLYSTETAKKEFSIPDQNNPLINQFMMDSLVYSIFNEGSHQASLKNIFSCGKQWSIENELFWLSKSFIESLSRKFGNRDVYKHVNSSNERILYQELTNSSISLSKDALNLLHLSEDLIKTTFYARDNLNKLRPKLNINRWDCGWKQIKSLIEFCKADISDFNSVYKDFENTMLQNSIDLGFIN